jgi:hypothetical protein
MKDDRYIHNCVLPTVVHRAMNGIFGAVVCFTAGAVGWEKFCDVPILGTICHWLVYLAVPFGIAMLFMNPRKVSLVEGHTSPDIAYDELTDKTKEDNGKQNQPSQPTAVKPGSG